MTAQTPDFARLDQFLTATAAQIPRGFEVLIVHNGREVYWKQFGGWPKDQRVNIASATKWLSGAVIMSLVDDGILSLDDPASKYLPYMTGEKQSITVRQLMSHTSGFGREFPLVDPCLADSSDTLDRCARALARAPLEAAPGTAFIYSGAGMQVAGRVAEVASGKDWQTLFRERIAGPLGMTSTDFEYEGPTQNPRISGGGRSTASDYMKFLSMLYGRGVFQGRRVLSTRAVDVMLADQVGSAAIVHSPVADDFRYGIGNWIDSPDSAGKRLQNSSIGLAGWTPLLDRSRNLQVVVGMQNALRPFQPYYAEFKAILESIFPPAALTPGGITNAASFEAGPVAPGEMLALFGTGFGPPEMVMASLADGSLPRDLAGTQVTFDGIAAPMLYTSATQAGVIAPPDLAGKSSVEVQVSYNGVRSPAVIVPVAPAWPALFSADGTGKGPGAILNQDGTVNSPLNPAAPGSILQLFGTGGGAQPMRVTIGGVPAAVTYAGPAPGLIPGVFQINVLLPSQAPRGDAVPVLIEAEGNVSLPVITVSLQ